MADLSKSSDEVRQALQKLATACKIAGFGDDAWDVIVAHIVELEAMRARAEEVRAHWAVVDPDAAAHYMLTGERDD